MLRPPSCYNFTPPQPPLYSFKQHCCLEPHFTLPRGAVPLFPPGVGWVNSEITMHWAQQAQHLHLLWAGCCSNSWLRPQR